MLKHDHKPAPPPPPPCNHGAIRFCKKCDAVECSVCGKEWLGPAEVARQVSATRWAEALKEPSPSPFEPLRGIGLPYRPQWGPNTGEFPVLCEALKPDDFDVRTISSGPGCLHGR